MHVEKEKMGKKKKPFALFVPKFDTVCADAKAPDGGPGGGWGCKREEQNSWNQGREKKGKVTQEPRKAHGEGDTSQAMQGCLDMLTGGFCNFQAALTDS